MTRRLFLLHGLLILTADKRFVFKIRTKSGGIIANIVIYASDRYTAENKLKERYPDCTILSGSD